MMLYSYDMRILIILCFHDIVFLWLCIPLISYSYDIVFLCYCISMIVYFYDIFAIERFNWETGKKVGYQEIRDRIQSDINTNFNPIPTKVILKTTSVQFESMSLQLSLQTPLRFGFFESVFIPISGMISYVRILYVFISYIFHHIILNAFYMMIVFLFLFFFKKNLINFRFHHQTCLVSDTTCIL